MESLSASRRNQILALLAVAQLMGVLDFSIVPPRMLVYVPASRATTGAKFSICPS